MSRQVKFNALRALRLGVIQLSMVFLAIVFVRREVWQFHTSPLTLYHWQQSALLAIAFFDGLIYGGLSARWRSVQNKPAYRKSIAFGVPAVLFLYLACGTLSERVIAGTFGPLWADNVRTTGVIIVAIGAFIRMWSCLTMPQSLKERVSDEAHQSVQPIVAHGPYKYVRYPEYAGMLLSLIGVPLVFNSWLPLVSLPGMFVVLKWHTNDQEAFRISQLGDPYLDYKKRTWNVIPFIY